MHRQLIAALLLTLATSQAWAGRALLLNAISGEALAMGGADVAVVGNTTAINVNPAGLTQIDSGGWDVYAEPYNAFGFEHKDSLGNDGVIDHPVGVVLAGSYARRLAALPDVVFGTGLFVQGGNALGYESLLTEFGNRDSLSANIGVLKLATGFGWKVNDRLSLGTSLGVSYVRGSQKFFPNTSDAESSFFGFRFDSGTSVQLNALLGLQFRPLPEVTLAAVYTSEIPLQLKNGTATFDFNAIGLGHVRYEKSRIDGFTLPQELDIGLAWQVDARWLLSVEYNWLDYSRAVRNIRLRASQPDHAAAPASVDALSPLNWRDQHVFAVGAAYKLDDRNTLRAGFNMQNNALPDSTLTPALNVIQQREITAGFGRKFSGGWALDAAVEYQLPVSQTYDNPSLPLGSQSTEHYELLGFLFTLSRRW
ncbi:MAG: outer membrane protein transport protein [Pseudomonadota bacterium]